MSADGPLVSVIRTSLSLIGSGFTVYPIFQKTHDAQILNSGAAPRTFGEALVVMGIGMLVVGIGHHIAFMVGLRKERVGAFPMAGLLARANRRRARGRPAVRGRARIPGRAGHRGAPVKWHPQIR
jgi:hypothetical protein